MIYGGKEKDHRGTVSFINDFQFEDVRRFYFIENIEKDFCRSWNGHPAEKKYFMCVHGSFLIGVVRVDNWESPSRDLTPVYFELQAENPSILVVPSGYANGVRNLTLDSKLMVLSNMTLNDSLQDKIRFPFDYWPLDSQSIGLRKSPKRDDCT